MKANTLRCLFCACLALLVGTRGLAAPSVILISMDGVRFDYLDREGLPALTRMAQEGARAEALVPVFPSSTFPNHVSLATGARADRHGIVGNRFIDLERGEYRYDNDASFIRAEPIWVTAERQGVRAASFFWVGSETDWNGVGASYRKAPFDDGITEAEKVAQILEWLDLPEPERPRLILSWWHGADGAGHRFGPDAERTTAQLRSQDAELARLLLALDSRKAWSHTTLLVVSDHGMIAVDEAIDSRKPLREAGIAAKVVQGGAYAHVHLEDPAQREAALAVLNGLPHVRAFPSEEVPEHLRYRVPDRTGDIVAFTDPPRALTRAFTRLDSWRRVSSLFGNRVGTHGYDPAVHPEMGAILLALGRGVAPGTRLGRVSTIDVAPTVSRLLGIAPPRDAEGRPIPGIGVATPPVSQEPKPSPR